MPWRFISWRARLPAREVPIEQACPLLPILPAVCGLGLAAVLLSSCSSKAPQQPARQAGISGRATIPVRIATAPLVGRRRVADPRCGADAAQRFGEGQPLHRAGQDLLPDERCAAYRMVGTASWYGTKFHGQATANGETYDLYGMTAAHKTLPLPSYVRVTNPDNGKSASASTTAARSIPTGSSTCPSPRQARLCRDRHRAGQGRRHRPVQWWAQRGRPAPMVLAQLQAAVAQAPLRRKLRRWRWPSRSRLHPAAGAARGRRAARCRSTQKRFIPADGLYLQVGAANPDAAELLKAKLSGVTAAPVFISSVVRNQQILHRVRLGPIGSADEVSRTQDSIRVANLASRRWYAPTERLLTQEFPQGIV